MTSNKETGNKSIKKCCQPKMFTERLIVPFLCLACCPIVSVQCYDYAATNKVDCMGYYSSGGDGYSWLDNMPRFSPGYECTDKTANQRRRGHEAREAEGRRSKGERGRTSEGESSDRIQNEWEPAIEMETVETVKTVSADSIGGRDGSTMGNTATENHSSLYMALAFGSVFGGGLFAIRRKVSLLNLMVVVVDFFRQSTHAKSKRFFLFSPLIVF